MSRHEFLFDGETVEAEVERKSDSFHVTVGEHVIELTPVGDNLYSVAFNGSRITVAAAEHKGIYHIDIDSVLIDLKEPSEEGFGGAGDHSGDKDKIFAPMPGKIVKIMVEVGDEVAEKQQMVIVEAMKMENAVLARAAGKVKTVNFAAGDQVDTDTPIIELEIEEE